MLIDVPFLLRFGVTPELPELWPAIGIGDVAVLSPQSIQPPTQIVVQIVGQGVIVSPPRLDKVLVFQFHGQGHLRSP